MTARDLAVMGATLADGGVNPQTGERVIDPDLCRPVLAMMTVAGLYETSGDWLFDVGLPGKSGIGGGIVTVSPGKGGLGHLRAAARRGGQQRQGAAGGALPLSLPGIGPAAVATPGPLGNKMRSTPRRPLRHKGGSCRKMTRDPARLVIKYLGLVVALVGIGLLILHTGQASFRWYYLFDFLLMGVGVWMFRSSR